MDKNILPSLQDLKREYRKKYIDICVNEYFVPICEAMLLLNKEVKSVVVSLAQYWNDNAHDEVHISFYPTSSYYTSWDDLFDQTKNKFCNGEYISSYDLEDKANKFVFNTDYLNIKYDQMFIDFFEKYCNENGSQNNNDKDNYTPYLIVSRPDNDESPLKIRNIGELKRIWE